MPGDDLTGLMQAFLGRLPSTRQDRIAGGYFIEGLVDSTSSAGVTFTLPTFDNGVAKFGPAPYDNIDFATTPPSPVKGARCLVCFVGGDIKNPWVLATWPNPGIG